MGILRLAVVAAAAVFVASGFDPRSSEHVARATHRTGCKSKTCDTPAFIQSEAQEAVGGELMTGAAAAEVADEGAAADIRAQEAVGGELMAGAAAAEVAYEEAMMDASLNAGDDLSLTVWFFNDEKCKRETDKTFTVIGKTGGCQKAMGGGVIITALSDSWVTMERYSLQNCGGFSNEADRVTFTMSQCTKLHGTPYQGSEKAAMVGPSWELILHSNPICATKLPGKGLELYPRPNLLLNAGMKMNVAGTHVRFKLIRLGNGKLDLGRRIGNDWFAAIDRQGVEAGFEPNTCVKLLKKNFNSIFSYAMVLPPPPAEKKPPFQLEVSAFSANGCGGSPSLSFQLEAAVGWCQSYDGNKKKDLMITEVFGSKVTVVVFPGPCNKLKAAQPVTLPMDGSCQPLSLPGDAEYVKISRLPPNYAPESTMEVNAFTDDDCNSPAELATFKLSVREEMVGRCQYYADGKDLMVTKVSSRHASSSISVEVKITVVAWPGWCTGEGKGEPMKLTFEYPDNDEECHPLTLPGLSPYYVQFK